MAPMGQVYSGFGHGNGCLAETGSRRSYRQGPRNHEQIPSAFSRSSRHESIGWLGSAGFRGGDYFKEICHTKGPALGAEAVLSETEGIVPMEQRNAVPPQYVSDELTHFVGRHLSGDVDGQFNLLVSILRSPCLRASYRAEFGVGSHLRADTRRRLSSNKAVREAVVCFCDIPLPHLPIHFKKYSQFGIAFSKRYLTRRGASPVFYVAQNAAPPERPGNGPPSLGEAFDSLYSEMNELAMEMGQFANPAIGQTCPGLQFTFKHSPAGTTPELQILGKLRAFTAELESMLFARLKFFIVGLPDEHSDNYYMEREWRKVGDLVFQWDDIARVILPAAFVPRLADRLPDFKRPLTPVDERGLAVPDGSG